MIEYVICINIFTDMIFAYRLFLLTYYYVCLSLSLCMCQKIFKSLCNSDIGTV